MAENSSRFARWQKIAIDQLGYALNLFLAFAVAILGYWFALLRDREFAPASSAKCAMLLSLAALLVSAITGVACVFTRLFDFRGTSCRARNHPGAPPRDELRRLGRITWRLFYWQVAAFAIRVVSLAVALLLTYGGKLA
jgi:hypothetical protein